jgi:hypothetical protein
VLPRSLKTFIPKTGFWGEYGPSSMFPYSIKHTFCSLGPNALTLNTLLAQSESIIPTVTSNLYASGKIKHNFIAVSFQPTNQEPIMGGEVTFGNTDSSKYTGNIHYV